MRLIDADSLPWVDKIILIDQVDGDVVTTIAKEHTSYVNNETPTIDAIPVGWIEKQIEKAVAFWNSGIEKIDSDGYYVTITSGAITAQILSNIIEKWREENGNTEDK